MSRHQCRKYGNSRQRWITYLGSGPEYDLIIIGTGRLGLRECSTPCSVPTGPEECGMQAGMVMVDSFRPALLYLRISHLSNRERYARVLHQTTSVGHRA